MNFFTLLLAIATAGASTIASAQSDPPQFAMREDGKYIDPNSIWRYAARTTKIPLNRKYQDLTREQREVLASAYVSMLEGDEPPFPEQGLQPLVLALTKAQDSFRVRGSLLLIVDVDSSGQATSVSTFSSPDQRMTQFASALLLLTKYKPAVCSGQPCRMQYPFHMGFGLE